MCTRGDGDGGDQALFLCSGAASFPSPPFFPLQIDGHFTRDMSAKLSIQQQASQGGEVSVLHIAALDSGTYHLCANDSEYVAKIRVVPSKSRQLGKRTMSTRLRERERMDAYTMD